jgi:hypothetical protein
MKPIMTIKSYSDKSFVVRGDTKPHREQLLKRCGKWNPNLRGGAGWIFSNKHIDKIMLYINDVEDNRLLKVNKSSSSRKRKYPIEDNSQPVFYKKIKYTTEKQNCNKNYYIYTIILLFLIISIYHTIKTNRIDSFKTNINNIIEIYDQYLKVYLNKYLL